MLCALTLSLNVMSASASDKKNGESNYATMLKSAGDVSTMTATVSVSIVEVYTLDASASTGIILVVKPKIEKNPNIANVPGKYGNDKLTLRKLKFIVNKRDLRIENSKCYLCRETSSTNSYLKLPGVIDKRIARSTIRNQDETSVVRT